QGMALYQFMARAWPGAPTPGIHVIRSLERGMDNLVPYAQSSILSFLVSWHTVYGGKELIVPQVAAAKRTAERLETETGAAQYLSFLADFRAAEAAQGDERENLIQAAELWLPDLHARHGHLGRSLIEKLRRGDDCSIRIDFNSAHPSG